MTGTSCMTVIVTAGAVFYLSTNASLDSSDTRLGARPMSALDASGTGAGSTVLTVPAGLPTASYYLIAVADGDGQVPETIETNNNRSVLLTVTAAP